MTRFLAIFRAAVLVLWYAATAAMVAVPLYRIANGGPWPLGFIVLCGGVSGALLLICAEGA